MCGRQSLTPLGSVKMTRMARGVRRRRIPRVQPAYFPPVLRGHGTNDHGGCYGSVLLDNELWQTLTATNGRDVPWVHGCVLNHGHGGDHGAPATSLDDEAQQWRSVGPTRACAPRVCRTFPTRPPLQATQLRYRPPRVAVRHGQRATTSNR
jgi:hypothetical protein